jgi:UPF0042 nucleotide-binding protein
VRIVIISGRSGSGKSTALHVMEDAGFYCIDNLPAGLLPPLVQNMMQSIEQPEGIAVSIDARNMTEDLVRFPEILAEVKRFDVQCEIVYLDAGEDTLITRFSETRRKHPLSNQYAGLQEAIAHEKTLLEPIAEQADIKIDTTMLNIYELNKRVRERVAGHSVPGLAILFQSFGFKSGVPVDADFVFDVRCLPNPHWSKELRDFTGLDEPVIKFLGQQQAVQDMLADIRNFLEHWLPGFAASSRTYMTIAIGCTGGKHRSVFLCEALCKHFSKTFRNVQVRHRELAQHH